MAEEERGKRLLFLETLATPPIKERHERLAGGAPEKNSAPAPADQTNGPEGANREVPKRAQVIGLQRPHANLAPLRPGDADLPRKDRSQAARLRKAGQVGEIREFPANVPQFPSQKKRSYALIISFVVCVILPTLAASAYYIFIAANQYVAEFRFAVTDSSTASTAVPSSAGLTALLGGMTTPSSGQNYLVTDYLTSREAVDQLQAKINIKKLYSRPIADWWSRFSPSLPIEKLVPYWQKMVTANYDPVTGLATAQVRAFTPQDAYLIASELVALSEKLVNDIATRPQRDAVNYAEKEVRRTQDRLKEIRVEITKFRNEESVINPNSSVVTSNVTLAQNLRATLVQLEMELASLAQQKISANAPTVRVLKSRINATKTQIATVEAQISKTTEGNRPLSKVVGQYEQLDLERQFAANMVTSAMTTLEQARANAAAQHLYITPYVRPALPQSSTYPNRVTSILTIAVASFMIWVFGLLLGRAILEHV